MIELELSLFCQGQVQHFFSYFVVECWMLHFYSVLLIVDTFSGQSDPISCYLMYLDVIVANYMNVCVWGGGKRGREINDTVREGHSVCERERERERECTATREYLISSSEECKYQ